MHANTVLKHSITTASNSKTVDRPVCAAGRGHEASRVYPRHSS